METEVHNQYDHMSSVRIKMLSVSFVVIISQESGYKKNNIKEINSALTWFLRIRRLLIEFLRIRRIEK